MIGIESFMYKISSLWADIRPLESMIEPSESLVSLAAPIPAPRLSHPDTAGTISQQLIEKSRCRTKMLLLHTASRNGCEASKDKEHDADLSGRRYLQPHSESRDIQG